MTATGRIAGNRLPKEQVYSLRQTSYGADPDYSPERTEVLPWGQAALYESNLPLFLVNARSYNLLHFPVRMCGAARS